MKVMLDKHAILPRSAHHQDAGYDLFTPRRVVLPANGSVDIDTGVHIQIPHGKCLVVISKSGLMREEILSTGLVDEGYNGSIHVILFNHSGKMYTFERGEKISQFIITDYYKYDLEVVDELEETERGSNGFGSSGR
jgi:dUTP pyrophosphatase